MSRDAENSGNECKSCDARPLLLQIAINKRTQYYLLRRYRSGYNDGK